MDRTEFERWLNDMMRESRVMMQGSGVGYSILGERRMAELFNMPHELHVDASSEEGLFEMLVRGEISERAYEHNLPRFQTKPLTRVEQIRQNKPNIKNKMPRLKPWQ